MLLKSEIFEVMEIKKETKAKFFGDINKGDLLQFEMTLKHTGKASTGGVLASYVSAKNLTQKTINKSKSQTEITNLLKNFEIKEFH
jgi:hypothetical protein